MKGLVLVSLAIALLLMFGCAGPQTPPVQQPVPQEPAQNVSQPAAEPVKNATNATPMANATKAAEPPPFRPIHLSYLFSNPMQQGHAEQKINFDYYFDEKTECGGRPALNGFMTASQQGQMGSNYMKLTAYLDTGEVVYSDSLSGPDIAFDTATPKVSDFDLGFMAQTLAARGGKKLLSDEIWNATKPVLLKNVAVSGGNGDYSITAGGVDKVAGLECKIFTISAKASNMEGQIVVCAHQLDDVPFSFVASGTFPGQGSTNWQLTGMTREKPTMAYYSQCLAPVSCPSVTPPTQQERDACSMKGNVIDTAKDGSGCATAYNCITLNEQAGKSMAQNQRPGCTVKDGLVQQAVSCWEQNGNVNYQSGSDGCVEKVDCST
ncbi:MAG: hypothetical protein WCY41_03650 [Candidatus Micrarchaeia archaeon]